MKLAIVVGHETDAPGATGCAPVGQSEYAWNLDLCARMLAHAETLPGVQSRQFLRDGVGVRGAYEAARAWGADAAIELHFNAAGPRATGSETLYVTEVSRALAEAVQDATTATLGLSDRGIKNALHYNGGRGSHNLMQMGGRPSILTEPFFGSNPGDCTAAAAQKDALARAQIDAAVGVLAAQPTDPWRVVTASALNLRGGPGTEFERLSQGPLPRGTRVEVIAQQGDWAQIVTDQGTAFVHAAFLA